jgi:ubiquinone/menaquinone biosynthesis C-methylase UbiE
VAAGGFSSAASTTPGRTPAYARAAVGSLLDALRGLGPGARVVDVGAGTGILTGHLSRSGIDCIGVEPHVAKLRQLRLALPAASAVLGVAEELPLADGSAQAYAAAGVFHRFDVEPALAEAARVLAPGGWLFLLWNVDDVAVRAATACVERSGHFVAGELSRHRRVSPDGAGTAETLVYRCRSTG